MIEKNWHFEALAKNDHTSAIADHVNTNGHNIKWNHFDILASKLIYHSAISKKHCLHKK